MCGGFNSSVIKRTVSTIESNYKDATVDLLTIGKKGNAILSKTYNVIASNDEIFDELIKLNINIRNITLSIIESYVYGRQKSERRK